MHQRDEIGFTRDFVDHLDALPVGDFGRKGTDFCTRGHLDPNQSGQPNAALTNRVASDRPVFLHFPDVRSNGAFAGADLFGEVHVRDASVGAKGREDGPVNFRESSHAVGANVVLYHPFFAGFFTNRSNQNRYSGILQNARLQEGGPLPTAVASVEGIARLQRFLDDIAELDLTEEDREWVQIDVATMLDGSEVLMHEVQALTGAALLFLPRGVVLVEPTVRAVRQYPRSLLHLFVEDLRKTEAADGALFRAELFSISPADEQLCWLFECYMEEEVPLAQATTARWMQWLNTA